MLYSWNYLARHHTTEGNLLDLIAAQMDDLKNPILVSDMAWTTEWKNACFLPLFTEDLYKTVSGSYCNHRGVSKVREVAVSEVCKLFKYLLHDGVQKMEVRAMPRTEYAPQKTIPIAVIEKLNDRLEPLMRMRNKKGRNTGKVKRIKKKLK